MSEAQRLHDAYVLGDLDAVRLLLGNPPDFPNSRGSSGSGDIVLEYAIYHSPIGFVSTLLDLGADPNYGDHSGFPSLIAALSATDRPDRLALVELLLDRGADIEQRGINDWTPLHYAACGRDFAAIDLLLARGADLDARTRIDDYATPSEECHNLGLDDVVEYLSRTR